MNAKILPPACAETRALMQPMLQGEPAPQARRHVGECRDCALQWTLASGIHRALGSMRGLEAPAGFPALVMARVRRAETLRERWSMAGMASMAAALAGLTAVMLPPVLRTAGPWVLKGLSASVVWLGQFFAGAWELTLLATGKIIPLLAAAGKLASGDFFFWWLAGLAALLLAVEIMGMTVLVWRHPAMERS